MLVFDNSPVLLWAPEKRPREATPHPFGNCVLLDPPSLGISIAVRKGRGGRYGYFLELHIIQASTGPKVDFYMANSRDNPTKTDLKKAFLSPFRHWLKKKSKSHLNRECQTKWCRAKVRPPLEEVSGGWIINKLDEAAEYHLKNYQVGLGGYWTPSEISIILQIIRKPNSIIILFY